MRKALILLLVAPACDPVRDVEFGIEERPSNLTCAPPPPPVPGSGARLERVFPEPTFDQGTTLARPPSDPLLWYVTEQHTGRIRRFSAVDGVDLAPVVLDLGDWLGPRSSEAGLLGMAFHPQFASNGELFVSYTAPGLTSTLSRFRTTDGGATFDLDGEEILLEVDQPFSNHNGGNVAFGPDGFLYFGLGDGGSGGDPGNRAQDPGTLLGKMLRIDVDGGAPYAIPPDNPYAGGGGRPEIYAIGLRNPYRFAFDSQSGDLWVGDVGQDSWEEVDIVERGGNYGWRVMEGPECFNPPQDCDDAGLEPPIAWYPNPGTSSVIFGAVYHGEAIPALQGAPIYSDFYSGDAWALMSSPSGADPFLLLDGSGRNIAHWAAEASGELLALDYQEGIRRLVPDGTVTPDPIPQTLSETGCVDPQRPDEPAPGLVPYGVSVAFWSDGADKRRWMALPDGTAATVGPDGDLDFPVGTVLVKEMARDGARIETRLFSRGDDGAWSGVTYAWRQDGSDADLVGPSGLLQDDLDPAWSIPSRGGCLQCHTAAAGHTLGLELPQLAGTYVYPGGRRADQIATLDHLGLVSSLPDEIPEPLRTPADLGAPVEERARAWLHVNCAGCHRPAGQADIDLRVGVPIAEMGLCGPPQRGDLGIADARIVAPGDPARSVLLARASRRDSSGMPPLASTVVDPLGVSLVEAWIAGLAPTTCP